jgi:hypothetical protein
MLFNQVTCIFVVYILFVFGAVMVSVTAYQCQSVRSALVGIRRTTTPAKTYMLFKKNKHQDDCMVPPDHVETYSQRGKMESHPVAIGSLLRRSMIQSLIIASITQFPWLTHAYSTSLSDFQRVSTQFIAAIDDPNSTQGNTAQQWGIWRQDPGPRGVFLREYQSLLLNRDNIAPRGWKFDPNDWWLEEHGLIMEAPDFPIPPGRYLVTGGRQVTTVLTIDRAGHWELEQGKLYDVTHLPCRSARYTPASSSDDIMIMQGSPLTARQSDFPVKPGAEMPTVPGCNKQDYAVLFVIGIDNSPEAREL